MSKLTDEYGNLITPQELNKRLTPEERSRNASAAGKASAESRRKRKAMRETLSIIMELPLTDKCKNPDIEKIKNAMELTEDKMDMQTGILVAMCQAAVNGNVNAALFIRDTLGEKPIEEIKAEVKDDCKYKALAKMLFKKNKGTDDGTI